jgi:hypothetical protein
MEGRVYVAGALSNAARVQEIQNKFRSVGISITYDWTTHGLVNDEKLLPAIGEKETEGVSTCDVLFLIQPGRLGSHTELGIAIGMNVMGKHTPIVILEEVEMEKKPFYYLEFINRFKTEQQSFEFALAEIRKKYERLDQIRN